MPGPPTPPATVDGPTLDVVLIGLRGSGKSTLGRALAERLNQTFVDLDDLTPIELGESTCAAAIQKHGEPAFREAERSALAGLLHAARTAAQAAGAGRVIALGGGTPTAPGVPLLLKHHPCRMVYLRATPATLRQRLAQTDAASRPSLTGRGLLDEIEELFSRRDPLYSALADRVINTDGMLMDDAITALVQAAA